MDYDYEERRIKMRGTAVEYLLEKPAELAFMHFTKERKCKV